MTVDGVDYSPAGIEGVREGLIELRDAALTVPHFQSAVLLSHAIALLADLKERMEVQDGQPPARPATNERSEAMGEPPR